MTLEKDSPKVFLLSTFPYLVSRMLHYFSKANSCTKDEKTINKPPRCDPNDKSKFFRQSLDSRKERKKNIRRLTFTYTHQTEVFDRQ